MKTIFVLLLFSISFCNAQTDTSIEEILNTESSDGNIIYQLSSVDVKPDFPGGTNVYTNFINKNYNPTGKDIKSGTVNIMFIVEKDGQLTNIKAVKTDSVTVDNLIRIIRSAPKWNPAQINGKPVRCSFTLPITLNAQ